MSKCWMKCVYVTGLLFLLLLSSVNVLAQDEEEGAEPAILERPMYVPIKPAFVVNYGGPGKLQYLKVELSLRVQDVSASNAARHHMPLIRDYLVGLLSRQTNETIETPEGKERLRLAALKGVQEVILAEDEEQGITDIFFNNFVVQR